VAENSSTLLAQELAIYIALDPSLKSPIELTITASKTTDLKMTKT
jgi:hypothetical protein